MQRDPPKRISDLYQAALACSLEERSAFLDEAGHYQAFAARREPVRS